MPAMLIFAPLLLAVPSVQSASDVALAHRPAQHNGSSGSPVLFDASPPCLEWDPVDTFAVSPPGSSTGAFGPTVHDSAGNAWAALWTIGPAAGLDMIRSNGHTGTWGAPVSVQIGELNRPETTIAPNDDVTVVWLTIESGNYRLFAARYTLGVAGSPPCSCTPPRSSFSTTA